MDPGIRLREVVGEDMCGDRSEGEVEDMDEELEIQNDGAIYFEMDKNSFKKSASIARFKEFIIKNPLQI